MISTEEYSTDEIFFTSHILHTGKSPIWGFSLNDFVI